MHPMEQFIRKIMNMYHSLLRLVFNKFYSPNSLFASNLIVWLWQRAVSFSCKIFEYFVLDTVRWCRRKPGRNSISFIQTLLWNWTLFNFCSTKFCYGNSSRYDTLCLHVACYGCQLPDAYIISRSHSYNPAGETSTTKGPHFAVLWVTIDFSDEVNGDGGV